MSNIFDRLTDSSAYTGTHKHRFDKDGKGRGRAGRDIGAKGKGASPSFATSNKGADGDQVRDLSQIVRPGHQQGRTHLSSRDTPDERSHHDHTDHGGDARPKPRPKPKAKKVVHKAVQDDDGNFHVEEKRAGGGGGGKPKKSPKGGSSIFDRLTDPANYTGAHKERFDKDGKGRGKAGRVQEGVGTKDLNELTRNNVSKGRSHMSS